MLKRLAHIDTVYRIRVAVKALSVDDYSVMMETGIRVMILSLEIDILKTQNIPPEYREETCALLREIKADFASWKMIDLFFPEALFADINSSELHEDDDCHSVEILEVILDQKKSVDNPSSPEEPPPLNV